MSRRRSDPKGRDVILAQISEYHRQRGNTILLVSHSMEDIGRVADRVLVMNNAHAEMYDETRAVFSRGELLEPMGLRLPQITSIMRRLRKMGLPVSETVLNVDEAVMELLPLLKKGRGGQKPCYLMYHGAVFPRQVRHAPARSAH